MARKKSGKKAKSRTEPAASSRPTIHPEPNGPYVIKGLTRLLDAKGEDLKTRRTMALCRCGQSKTKPFCDGTHQKFGFNSAKTTDGAWDFRENYVGQAITVHDNRGICAHAGFCTSNLPKVWKMGVEPWIDPDGAAPNEMIETIRMCPSGALSYSVDGVEHRDQDRSPTVQVTGAGPYYVTGGVVLEEEPRGEGASLEHYTLCRCGGSKNKPFCDGSHYYIGFADPGVAGEAKVERAEGGETAKRWHRVAGVDDLVDGEVRAVVAGTRRVAVLRVNGQHAALSGACPHQGGPLGEGTITDGVLRCPWHGWAFDALTGAAASEDYEAVATFPVALRDDGVYVQVEEVVRHVTTVSDVMVETMVNGGVTHVFGMVGHSNLGLTDALRRQVEKGHLTYIGIRHEGAAAFACSGFAKLSGRPAACLTIAGPGATNLLTGLWDAKVDRAPVLALTGQVQTQVLGPGAFQEIDLANAFAAVSAWSQTVLHDSSHAELMALALKHAIVRRDVAHLIFPDEVQVLPAAKDAAASSLEGRLGRVEIAPSQESVEQAVKVLAGAKRPAIIVGYGARGSMEAVTRLAERLGSPVLTTFKGKGQISDAHPLAAGVLGRSGTPIASWFMNNADVLLVFGASFSHHTGIDDTKRIIQVDFERLALGKFHPVDVPVWGEIGVTAEQIEGLLPKKLAAEDQRVAVAARWKLWRDEKQRRRANDEGKGINSALIFDALTHEAPANAVVAVDVGNNTYSFGRYFECRDQSVLMSGYLGSIGFGFPAAMGAWAAAPERPVIAVTGDGGFGQYMGEFTTAVKHGMNITHLLVNNGELGKISKEQRAGSWPVWQTELHNPNFAEFAENCGGQGRRVTRPSELRGAIRDALAYDGPAMVEVMADSLLI